LAIGSVACGQVLVIERGESSGAVSPEMRASANKTPVMIPASAARYRHLAHDFPAGTPSASACFTHGRGYEL